MAAIGYSSLAPDRGLLRCILLLAAIASSCGVYAARPVVALLTDFGLSNEAVGLCHGAMLSVNSDIEVVDLCHTVDAYDIGQAALMLRGATAYPKGTVFVCVVDPGVGTQRQPIALKTSAGYYYVGPNNGLFSYVAREQGVEALGVLDPKLVNEKWKPGTFDGRDLFSPAGALLAIKQDITGISTAGDPRDLVILPAPAVKVNASSSTVEGSFIRTDEPYGNLWTNITSNDLTSAGIHLEDTISLTVGKLQLQVPFVTSFGHVTQGKPLAYLNSSGTLAFAINMGNFVKTHNLKPGQPVVVKKAAARR